MSELIYPHVLAPSVRGIEVGTKQEICRLMRHFADEGRAPPFADPGRSREPGRAGILMGPGDLFVQFQANSRPVTQRDPAVLDDVATIGDG